jgi:glycosyltransferase involved in cell wall biosynthesis
MKIVFVTKSLPTGGGASRFAFELAAKIRAAGDEVQVFTYSSSSVAGAENILPSAIWNLTLRHLDWRLARAGLVGLARWDYSEIMRRIGQQADVFHVHDSYEAISPLLIARLRRLAPVLHTMHDTSSFTGGCINPMGCDRYKSNCGRCPQRETLGRHDFTRLNLRIRRRAYSNTRVHCAFPSRWIMGEACSSLRLGDRARHVANGFDPSEYSYKSRDEARKILQIPPDAKVVVAGAHTIASPHKGFGYVVGALQGRGVPKLTLILLGNASPDTAATLGGIRIVAPGYVREKDRLALYYSAADLMLFPSMGDNLPTMIQESMYARTPVLAFATGGIPEIIDDNENGWLVPRGDGAAFTAKLMALLSTPNEWSGFGDRARSKIEGSFSMAECVRRYTQFYQRIVNV